MQDYQQRVIDEKAELDERLAKLNAFIDGPKWGTVPDAEQLRMLRQSRLMMGYSSVLGERIAAFTS